MSCVGCSSKEGPVCKRCMSILGRNKKEITDLTPRTLAYMMALQGLMASGKFYVAEPTLIVQAAINAVDALFTAVEQTRLEKNKR